MASVNGAPTEFFQRRFMRPPKLCWGGGTFVSLRRPCHGIAMKFRGALRIMLLRGMCGVRAQRTRGVRAGSRRSCECKRFAPHDSSSPSCGLFQDQTLSGGARVARNGREWISYRAHFTFQSNRRPIRIHRRVSKFARGSMDLCAGRGSQNHRRIGAQQNYHG